MKSIFLADSHLRNPDDQAYRELISFLKQLPDDLDNLFILGDFFDFWHGYQEIVYSYCVPILTVLKELSEKGIKIHFFAGNHEVSSGPALEEIGSYYPDDAIIELDGKKIYLAHGDRLNPEDYPYRFWRALLRSRFILKLIDITPAYITLKVANILSRDNQSYSETRKFIPPQVFNRCATILDSKDDIQAIVIGHFHQIRQETFATGSGPKTLYILGDWVNDRSYLLLQDGQFSFHPSACENA
ncbi:MAG: UDP-2,3-diacylglucosamine diphosphatase [Deltaproteobacteria bacterium]|nr:UDP-2,3-diacylglucosamine diphosphatase [Deltaproteobacteria bacterium]